MHFPVADVDVFPLIPVGVAFAVSLVTSMGGVSGAFVLLPFQVSVLGFVGPAVTPTNHLFNVVAIPSGVWRYARERRLWWPLASLILAGTVPGVIAGSLVRIYLLPDPRHFQLFMGIVLLLIAWRLGRKVFSGPGAPAPAAATGAGAAPLAVETVRFDARRLACRFDGRSYEISTPGLLLLTAAIGVIGGAYGVGGGAIIAPFLVSMYGLPVHVVAGATLLGTCTTSVVGVAFFAGVGPLLGRGQLTPDWLLGLLFGLGGMLGMYLGARLQKRVPSRPIEALLAIAVGGLAVSYVVGFCVA